MAPDCEKFLRLKLASTHSHTLASIFYFSCPVSLVVAFVFHLLVRRPLLAHLPKVLYQRVGKYASFNWLGYFRQYYWGVLLSIVVGAALHLLWDSFTHLHPLTVRMLPGITGSVQLGPHPMPIFYIVAAASSLVGGLLIGWAVWKMPVSLHAPAPTSTSIVRYWATALGVAATLEVQWLLLTEPRLLNAGISAISAGIIGVVVSSVYTARHQLLPRQ
jgi:hypothetical protein